MVRRVMVGGVLTFGAGLGMGFLDGVWGAAHGAVVALGMALFALWVHGATG